MASQSHNTSNSASIIDTIEKAVSNGWMTKEKGGDIIGQHLGQQIDGGVAQRQARDQAREQEAVKRGAPADNTKDAMDKFSKVTSETTESPDGRKTSKLEASGPKQGMFDRQAGGHY